MNTFFSFFGSKFNQKNFKGFSKNPFFYFGVMSFALFGILCLGSGSLAGNNYLQATDSPMANPFFRNTNAATSDNLFFSQNGALALETPDLKIIQDNSISAITTPSTTNAQTLGDIFGGSVVVRREVIDYTIEIGDTVDSVAAKFGISSNTILWANELSKGAVLKVGDTLAILPVSGVLHVVKSGDTVSQIAKTYKAKIDDIVTFNNLTSEEDIFIGDILIVPDGVMPSKSAPSISTQIPLPGSTFISPFGPAKFRITQGLHYFNAIDLQSLAGAGSPVYAAAAGLVQRASYDRVGGNRVTILHANGVVTYYGHLSAMLVKPGDQVYMGQQIGTEGQTGEATGPHVHFEVVGARNPYAGIPVGTVLSGNK